MSLAIWQFMIRDSFCVNDSDVVGGKLLIFVNGLTVVVGELSSYLYSSSRVHSSNVNRRSMLERNLQKLFLEKNRTSEVTVAEIDVMHNGINIPVIRDSSNKSVVFWAGAVRSCLLYTSPSPRDGLLSRMPSSA